MNWRESIARLEALGDWGIAKQFAAQMFERAPEYAGAHFAVALSAQHDGETQIAASEFALAAKAEKANADLPELHEIRAGSAAGKRKAATNAE